MVLRQMRIGARLALGFGVVVAIMLALSFAGIWLGKKSRDDLASVVGPTSAKQILAAEMKALTLEQSAVMRNIGLHNDIKAMQVHEDRARRLGKDAADATHPLSNMVTHPQEPE